MVLAKSLYDSRGTLILPAGTELKEYKEQIAPFNIHYLLVEDEVSQGIEVPILLSDETRLEVHEAMRRATVFLKPVEDYKKKTFFTLPYTKVAWRIAEDIYALNDTRIDVTELAMNKVMPNYHCLNVAILATLIGRLFELPLNALFHLCMGGFLHDIGMLAVPEEVLEKIGTGKMSQTDIHIYRQYPAMGFDMIKHNQALDLITKSAVFQHMERYDGNGFPSHKTGEETTLAAKIMAIADTFDTLHNGLRIDGLKPMKIYEIIEFIQNNSGTAYDPDVVDVFVNNAQVFPNGTMVKLSNGCKGIVVNQNHNLMTRPIVRITHSAEGKIEFGMVNLLEDMSLVVDDIEL